MIPCCLCHKPAVTRLYWPYYQLGLDDGYSSNCVYSKEGIPVIIVYHHKCFKKWHKYKKGERRRWYRDLWYWLTVR